jgi:hypothetical protein
METTSESGVQVIDADGPAWEDLLGEVLTDDPDLARSSFIRSAAASNCDAGLHCSCDNSHPCTSTTPSLNTYKCSGCGGEGCTG